MTKNKYYNKPTTVDGHNFDSKAEAARYAQLLLLQQAGEISELEVHPSFVLVARFRHKGKWVRALRYEGDFGYIENGRKIVEDVKGVETALFKVKQKLFWSVYPDIELRVVSA